MAKRLFEGVRQIDIAQVSPYKNTMFEDKSLAQ